MKRTGKYISVCLCAVMIASMFMCGGCQKQEKTKITKKKQIELWHYWDIPGNQQHLEELVDQFNQSQDKIEVKVSYIPDEDFKKQLALSMSEEKMPDIALVDSSDFQFLHQMKPFADLTDEIPELQEYSEKALAPCSADGRIYGQPFGVNCTAMFYNKKILEKAGCKVPDNWEEFEEIAAKVSDKTIKGFAITALQTEESMYEFLPILWSMGGDIHRINTASGQQAFLFLRNMEQEGSLSLQSISLTMGDLTNQFIKGKIAMMFNSSMAIDIIREGNPDLEFGVAAIPCGDNPVTVAGGEILAVANNENKEYSWQDLRRVKIELYFTKGGGGHQGLYTFYVMQFSFIFQDRFEFVIDMGKSVEENPNMVYQILRNKNIDIQASDEVIDFFEQDELKLYDFFENIYHKNGKNR